MLVYAVTFFALALSAAVFGFAGIHPDSAHIARILFFVFLLLSLVAFIANTADRPTMPKPPSKKELAERVRLGRIEELKTLFRIGKEFDYLGLRLRVVNRVHQPYTYADESLAPYARLTCEYVAPDGVITSHWFSLEEAREIAKGLHP